MTGGEAVGHAGIEDRRRGDLLGFGTLHACNTALNMGFTLLQLLVLARILPISRYSEVVFLATIGFYLQPIDQAIGRSNFVALQRSHEIDRRRYRSEIRVILTAHLALVLIVALVVPSLLQTFGSSKWIEDVLFLFLGLAINMWAFDLQSTAWAIGRNLLFVEISILHRLLHLSALVLAFVTGSFVLFVGLSSAVTVLGFLIVFHTFSKAGILGSRRDARDWAGYIQIFRWSFLATLSDFMALNAPYGLVAMRFGIGSSLVAFDSVMKVARIAMAGARTLAEIALPRHSALVAGGRLANARSMFRAVLGLSVGLTLIPCTTIFFAGEKIFHILLGRNDVVPLAAMPAAALIVAASSVYQPASFFLSFSNKRGSIGALSLAAFLTILAFGIALYVAPLTPAWLLSIFAVTFAALASGSAWLADRIFQAPSSVAVIEPATLVNESV